MQLFPIEACLDNYYGDQMEDILLPVRLSRAHFLRARPRIFSESIVPPARIRPIENGIPLAQDHRESHGSAVKLSGRSIMAKSFVYFSAGVSGESRPPRSRLPATDVDYVVTSWRGAILFMKKDRPQTGEHVPPMLPLRLLSPP